MPVPWREASGVAKVRPISSVRVRPFLLQPKSPRAATSSNFCPLTLAPIATCSLPHVFFCNNGGRSPIDAR